MVPTRADATYAVLGIALALVVGVFVAATGPVFIALPLLAVGVWLAARAVGIVVVAPKKLVLGVTALLPALASMTQILPGPLARVIPIAALVMGIVLMPRTLPVGRSTSALVAAYAALIVVAVVRGWDAGSIPSATTMISLALLVALTAVFGLRLFTSGNEQDRYERALALALAPAVFVACNMFVHVAGPQLPFIVIPDLDDGIAAGNPATMLVSLGFGGAERILYPLAQGVNAFGVVAALGIVTCTLTAWQLRKDKGWLALLFGSGTALCLAGTLTSDSRTALLVATAFTAAGLVRLRSRAIGRMAVLAPLAPLALVAVLSALASTTAATLLSRDGGDFATGTGRTEIWSAIWNGTLADLPFTSLVGWGANGQLTSGAYHDYAYIFGDRTTQTYTAHDIYLQTILDIGWVGLVFVVAVFALAAIRLLSSPRVIVPAFGWALLALMFCGITEAIPSYQFPETLTLFVLLLTADARGGLATSKPNRQPAMAASGKLEW